MIMIDWWKTVVLKRYAQFDGRAGRAEYWWFVLANFIVGIVLRVLWEVSGAFAVVYIVWVVALFIPSLAAAVRRLHDTDRSGWFVLLSFIPLVGLIILIVFLASQGSASANKYGPPDSGVPVA